MPTKTAKKLTKKESIELLRDWIVDRIIDYGEYGECDGLTDEEKQNTDKAKDFLIGRLGRIDENAVHTANQKLKLRPSIPHEVVESTTAIEFPPLPEPAPRKAFNGRFA